VTPLLADRLRLRAQRNGAGPLLTYHDLLSGERTELSGVSFLNWVDKASNLLVDEYLLEPGAVVDVELARSAPGHWMTFVLETAAWQVGATVRVSAAAAPSDLLVLGPDWADHDRTRAGAVLACSLHPLGLGFTTALPAEVADFSLEVRGQSDYFPAGPRAGAELAWEDDSRRLTQADLLAGELDPAPRRRLVRTSDPWRSVREGIIVPVLTGGSAVVAVGHNPVRLHRIVETERVDVEPAAGWETAPDH
jgi:uncharacterized protein (TIGR03089 family)